MTTYLDVIQHYQRSIEKASNDETRLLHCIDKLYRLPVTVEHLQQTGIGKTVNSLRKYDKEVGVAAKALVAKWKAMVAAEEDIVEDEDAQKVDDDDQSNDDNDKYNGSHNGENSHNNHKHKQSSNRNDKSSDSDSKDKRHREKGREGSRDKRHSSSDSKRINNIVSDRHNHDKNINSSSKSHKDKHASNDHHRNDKHNRDRRNEEKFKSSSNHSSKKARSPEPIHESPTHMSDDDNFYDDDDEDEEKLVIDTENNKEKVEQSTKHSSSDSSKSSSKSSSHHKSKSSSKDRSDKEREKSKTESTKTSSSSKSHSSDKVDNHKHEERHRHKSDKKDHDKSSHRSNGDHKSSSSSSKSKHHEKPKEDEKKNSTSSSSKESSSKSHSKSSSSKSDSHKSSKEKHKSSEDKSDSSSKSSKRKHESADDSNSEEEQTSPKKAKTANKQIDGGIDSSMGKFSFEEALGLMAPPSKSSSKLKSPKMNGTASSASSSSTATPTKSESSTQHSSKKIDRSKTPPLLTAKAKLEPLDPKLSLELPTISNNYKPLPLNPAVMDCVFSNNVAKPPPPKRVMSDAEALQSGIQSKTIRTKIYSGMKTGQLLQVPTLFQLCIRVLQKNIDGLEYTGGVPFEVLKPVLELATPEQLQSFEEYNPYLLEDTDDLWRIHCGRRYKTQKREELESWREMFVRCKEKEEERLSLLTKNITFQQKQISAPVRRTQLAYVDIDVKAPRNIQRKQEQYGTKGKMAATPAARVEALAKIAPTVAKAGDIRLRIAAETRDTAQASSHSRPKKAPLMQKTLQLMRGRFKR